MMLVLLIAVAASQTLFKHADQANCGYITSVCDSNANCIQLENGIETAVTGMLATSGVDHSQINGVPTTTVGFLYAMSALGANVQYAGGNDLPLPIANIYQCECENAANNACSWPSASAIADATSVCLQDAACVANWEGIVNVTTTEMGCTWDAPAAVGLLQFPSTSANTMDQFCVMFSAMMQTLNTKAVNLFTTLLAHAPGMETASDIMNYCQMLGDVANSANACLSDTVTNCANVWADIAKTTADKGVKWQDTTLGLKTPVAKTRESILALNPNFPDGQQQDTKEYCKVFAYAMAQNNIRAVHLLMTLNANVMPVGVGDDISAQCNKGMQGLILGLAFGAGFGMMFLTLMGVCIYNKMCKSKN